MNYLLRLWTPIAEHGMLSDVTSSTACICSLHGFTTSFKLLNKNIRIKIHATDHWFTGFGFS
jgi:hypothetical protein